MLCSNGLTFWDLIIDCRGFGVGTAGTGARRAGPASDILELVEVEAFLRVEGMGIPERALARGSKDGCITDRRRGSMVVGGRETFSISSKYAIEVYQ